MAETIRIRGAKEFLQVLKGMPDRVARTVVRGALMKAANVVRKEAIARAPRGTRKVKRGKEYGRLYQNIRRATIKRGRDVITVDVGIGRAFWGRFLEFGTKRMDARPWFAPAWESSRRAALTVLESELGKRIERAAEKLAREHSVRIRK